VCSSDSPVPVDRSRPSCHISHPAKAALRSYTRTWTREFTDRGIRFNTLSPGPIDTSILDGQADSVEAANEIKAQFVAAVPLNRLGRPEEIAAAALFLASDDSSFVAGAELSVDGDQHHRRH
jgi:NAD(P)-dependent dehydrogenase (short-subunit alcohol dehydrogenase family)